MPLQCRPGFFCPVPDRKVPCPAGAFCPRASVAMTTCNYQELLDRRPKTIIPAGPVTVLAQVYDQGTPIGGNICPPMSTSPSDVRACRSDSPPLRCAHCPETTCRSYCSARMCGVSRETEEEGCLACLELAC